MTDTPDLTLFPEAALPSLTLGLKVSAQAIAQELVGRCSSWGLIPFRLRWAQVI